MYEKTIITSVSSVLLYQVKQVRRFQYVVHISIKSKEEIGQQHRVSKHLRLS